MHLLLAAIFSILSFGTIGNGSNDNTIAINKAIETCAKQGGGRVVVPQGIFLTGTVQLRSNVYLQLEKGAVIKGSSDLSAYESFSPTKDLSMYDSGAGSANANSAYDKIWTKALFLGSNLTNAGIIGKGIIDGSNVFNAQGEENMRGPHTILIAYSTQMRFEGITICKASNYAFLAYDIAHTTFNNLHIEGGWDGIHIRGAKSVDIKGCHFFTGDDGIAGGYWDKMRISDCEINSSCNGIRMIQPATNLLISDCYIYGPGTNKHITSGKTTSDAAISLEPGGWGPAPGLLDKITIQNLRIEKTLTPLSVTLSDDNELGRLVVRNIVARDITRMALSVKSWGKGHTKQVEISDVDLQFRALPDAQPASYFIDLPTHLWRFFPSWGMYFRNVDNVKIKNAHLSYQGKEDRKAITWDNVGRIKQLYVEVRQ